MPPKIPRKRKILFAIGAMVVAVLFLELALRAAVSLLGLGPLDPREKELQARRSLNVYEHSPWAEEYFMKELKAMTPTLDPLVGWRPREFHGKYINVGSDGMRRGVRPAISTGPVIKVFMFGGSTMWGAGARDEYTIPSLVSKLLNASAPKGAIYDVRNYGQSGYVLLNEAAKLSLLLQEGKRPDVVIFYDGVNDVSYSYQVGKASVLEHEKIIRDQFAERLESSATRRFISWAKATAKRYCITCRLGIDAIRRFSPGFLNEDVVLGSNYTDEKLGALGGEIALDYRERALTYLNGLSKAFNFKLVAIWQPTLFTEEKLIGEETDLAKIDPHAADAKAAVVYRAASKFLPDDPARNFYNFTGVLAGREKEYYIDFGHVSEEGNVVIAKKIVELLRARYDIR